MGQFYDSIPPKLIKWILEQHLFWVASAPLSGDAHVNVSPKGLDGTFHIVNENKVWYEDFTGSTGETIAHLKENGRITILFGAFDGPARIARLFGVGTYFEFGTPEYEELISAETRRPGSRGVVVVDVHKVGTSCGFGIPIYNYVGNRPTLLNMSLTFEKHDQDDLSSGDVQRSDKGLKAYWEGHNTTSIDGLPGMDVGHLSPKPLTHVSPPDGEKWPEPEQPPVEILTPAEPPVNTSRRSLEVMKGVSVDIEILKMLAVFLIGWALSGMYSGGAVAVTV
ncbi:uncharacterized protein FIBRA_01996 [Fibroporia radiculosa]|uniref:Uncharacterized protein n=1 Tax=Fibroporia radiculosa TaxID=599839 RepID=J4I8T5_9APHY|nr:uncharacterized protein FIBRA_01996 [Fibroporia radiculosa]CCL99971.1 predicted protein [Fibroporia radiculosa]